MEPALDAAPLCEPRALQGLRRPRGPSRPLAELSPRAVSLAMQEWRPELM